MKENVASGPDGISSVVLRNCAPSIHCHLCSLFNLSLSQGKVPDDWKNSNVTPIFKSGDESLAQNYRPISLLSLSSKVLKRLVHVYLTEHVMENNLLSRKQFGFRSGSSTQEAILSATRNWHDCLEEGASVVCVFLDLSKAFDSLPHSLVLESLQRVGVCGSLYNWFEDYLSHRKQKVVLDGESSDCIDVTSGVPQGSILGPLLFSLSIDPLTNITLTSTADMGLYADDIVYWKKITCEEDLLALQCDVDGVVEGIESINLNLNIKKTKCLVISRKRSPPKPKIRVHGDLIDQVASFKYLGVLIDEKLSWNLQISHVCCKAKRLLGYLYRSFKLADRRCLSHLYKSLVLPILDYCSCVWDPHLSGNVNKLEKVQTFAARLVTGKWSEGSEKLREELSWPLLSTRRSFQKLSLCRRILNGHSLIPDTVFPPNTSSHLRHPNSRPLNRRTITNTHSL